MKTKLISHLATIGFPISACALSPFIGLAAFALVCTSLKAQPANDDCATPTVVSQFPYSETLDLATATSSPSDPVRSCSQYKEQNVWYRFTPASAGTLTVQTSCAHPLVVAIYTGNCGALSEVLCQFLPNPAAFNLAVQAGTTYLIEVAAWGGQPAGTMQLTLHFFPWVFKQAPYGDGRIDKICIDPDNDYTWYVASATNGLYITRDAGNTWERHLQGLTWGLCIDPANPTRVYAGSDHELYRSDNKGYSWSLVKVFPSDIFVYSILVSRIDGSVFVGMYWGYSSSPNGMYRSTDYGQSWDFYPFNIPPLPYNQDTGLINWDIAEDPINGFLYASTEVAGKPACFPSCYNPPTLRSKDRGQTWQNVSGTRGTPGALPWHATRLQVDPITEQVYFQVEGGVIYVSTNSGDFWAPHGSSGCWDLIIDPNFTSRFFGGGLDAYHQVQQSMDGGKSFVDIGPAQLRGSPGLFHVALNRDSTRLYASYATSSAASAGIFVTDITTPPLQLSISLDLNRQLCLIEWLARRWPPCRCLYQTTNLAGGNWLAVTNEVTLTNGVYQVKIPGPFVGNYFYRLQ